MISDGLWDLRRRYQEALKRLANEMQLPEAAVTKIIDDLGHASDGVPNLRGVFAGGRINHALNEIAVIASEYDALCGRTVTVQREARSHTKLLLRRTEAICEEGDAWRDEFLRFWRSSQSS